MPDSIGRIEVPSVAASGTFPLVSDYPFGRTVHSPVAVHRFESANGKIEQRFKLGPARVVHRFQRENLCEADVKALRDFWIARDGVYQPFTYNAPADDHGDAASAVTVRFADETLTLDHLGAACRAGLEMVEIPGSAPSYTVSATLDRFPSAGFATALLEQEHEIVPLLKIRVSEAAVDDVLISDRRCTVGGALYLERLLGWSGVTQTTEGSADVASFSLGNADGVMREFAADTNLRRAWVTLSLYHVGSQTLVNVWSGRVPPSGGWEGETDDVFALYGSDPIEAVNLPYPRRKVSRRCWKTFDDGVQCPYSSVGSLNGSYPSASAASCDKGWETPNGCRAHNMDNYHGGIQQSPQRALIKLSNTGFVGGVGRRRQTVSSLINETAFHGAVVPEVWTNLSTSVPGLIVAGRDEDEFYDALAVICEGPVAFGSGHRLDGQAHHGPGGLGLRVATGTNPQSAAFGITGSGDPTPTERAAGTAFIELRRTDAEGIQLSQAEEHSLTAVVSQGLAGWKWTSGVRSSVSGLANPIWVAANMWLRHLGLEAASDAAQKAVLDVAAAEVAAGYCDASVSKIVGSGSTTQFLFRGVIGEQRPFRDWLTEVLANCLGYYTFRNGKLRLGVRVDSASVESFTAGNVLWRSLRATAFDRTATRFTAYFGERLVDSSGVPLTQSENVVAEDEDAALEAGDGTRPAWLEAERDFVGTDTRDQAARLAVTRLRELTGGVTAAERAAARQYQWGTTVLALAAEPGQVDRLTHDRVPGGDVECRVQRIEFLPDYSVVLTAKTTTDSMYDYTVGSLAADVEPDTLPDEVTPQLDAPDVTSFNAQEDPEVDPATGQTMSRVTVSYNEPAGASSFQGVEIWAQHYDGTSEGTPGSPIEEPVMVARIGVNATPAARRLPLFPVTGKALRVMAASYNAIKVNPLSPSTDPSDFVLLDGKQSAPTQPANPWCQWIPGGLDISADKNPEDDLEAYLIAFTGNKLPYDLGEGTTAIKPGHVIGELPARNVTGERWHFAWQEPIYEGLSNGTNLDLESGAKEWTANEWLVEVADGVFEGVNVQILDESGAVVANHAVVSNTAERLVFASSSIPTGRLRFRFRGSSGEALFFVAARDRSKNVSEWAAVPPCEILARDGTTDRDRPLVHSPAPGTFQTYFTAGFTGLSTLMDVASANNMQGVVGVQVTARSETEAETDANAAKMYSIRGLHTVEIELTYSADGSTSLVAQVWRFPWKGEGRAHVDNVHLTGWIEKSRHVIDLPGVMVASARARVANSWGFGPWQTCYAEFVRAGGGPVATGSTGQRVALIAESSSGTVAGLRIDRGLRHVFGPLTGALAVNLPSPAAQAGEEIELEIIQPVGSEGYQVTLAAGYKDYGPISRLQATKTVLRFRAESGTVLRCTGQFVLPYVA